MERINDDDETKDGEYGGNTSNHVPSSLSGNYLLLVLTFGFAQVAIQNILMIDVDWLLINGWWFAAII